MKIINRFHYLTQDLPDISHAELAEIACANGIRWVQLRVKNKPEADMLAIAREVRAVTQKYNAILIINDRPEIALASGADGVHLGKTDMPVVQARKLLGPAMIIGGTANTLEDVLALSAAGVDYIGLGPFRFTSTKQHLSPVLGIDGYRSIVHQTSHFTLPLIAIGGIQAEDVKPLLEAGVHGVAVSSAINLAADKPAVIRSFLDQFSLTSK